MNNISYCLLVVQSLDHEFLAHKNKDTPLFLTCTILSAFSLFKPKAPQYCAILYQFFSLGVSTRYMSLPLLYQWEVNSISFSKPNPDQWWSLKVPDVCRETLMKKLSDKKSTQHVQNIKYVFSKFFVRLNYVPLDTEMPAQGRGP